MTVSLVSWNVAGNPWLPELDGHAFDLGARPGGETGAPSERSRRRSGSVGGALAHSRVEDPELAHCGGSLVRSSQHHPHPHRRPR